MRTLRWILLSLYLCAPAWATERVLTDDAGRTVSVPAAPQRIVVMHEPLLGIPLMDLGLNPVGAYGRRQDGRFVTAVDFVDTVFGEGRTKPAGFGTMGQIDLARLRALKPDLIVGTELDIRRMGQLSRLAPVYIQNVSQQHVRGFVVEERLAGVVGRRAEWLDRRKRYGERLAAVRDLLKRNARHEGVSMNHPQTPTPDAHNRQLSITDHGKTDATPNPSPRSCSYLAILLTDQINVVGEMSGAIQALEDLGYRRLPLDDSTTDNRLGSTLMLPISAEVFGRLNPDLLVVMNNYTNKSGTDQEAEIRTRLEKLLPGWERFLKPAREGRMLLLDSRKVTTPSVQSALHTLDAVATWSGNTLFNACNRP